MLDGQHHQQFASPTPRLVVVFDRDWANAWEFSLIERAARIEGLSVAAIVQAPSPPASTPTRSWLIVTAVEKALSRRLFHQTFRRNGMDHDRTRSLADLSREAGIPLAVDPSDVAPADYVLDLSDVATTARKPAPSQTVMRLECGEPNPVIGQGDGFAEVLGKNPISVCRLIIECQDHRRTIERSFRTFLCSWSENARRLHWQGAMLVLDTLKLIAAGRFPAVEDTPQTKSVVSLQAEKSPSQPRFHRPVGALIEMMRRSLHRLLQRNLTDDEWSVFLTPKFGGADTIRQYTGWHELKPPQDRAWADPFVIERDGRTFVFVEEVPYATQRGSIVCLEWTPSGVHRVGVALEEPHHLSYPFLFEHQGDLFMLPESSAAKELVLWRCIDFPLKWQRHKVLFQGVSMVDSTVVRKEGLWWLFTTIDRVGGGDLTAELHAYHAADPVAGDWKPHALNPLLVDPRMARMAGTIAEMDGRLIRFSQGSSFEYGDRLHMRRITDLTPAAYKEDDETTFFPADGHIAFHHFSRWNNAAVVDCCRRKPRWSFRAAAAKARRTPKIDLSVGAATPPEPIK